MNENKKLLEINNIGNNIIDIIEILDENIDEFEDLFIDYNKSNSFILKDEKIDEIIDEIEKNYNVVIIDKYYNDFITYELIAGKKYIIENKLNYKEIEIIDPLFVPLIFNDEFLKDLFKIELNKLNVARDEIYNLINDEIDYIYKLDDHKYINHYSIKNNINSYELLLLFNNIISSRDENIIEDELLIELFENVLNELNKLNVFNTNRKFNIDISNITLLRNKHLLINSYFLENEIDENILKYDIDENIEDELIDLFDPIIYNEINEDIFYENILIDEINDDLNIDLNYYYEFDEKNNLKINNLEISIEEIFKIVKNIYEKTNKLFALFDPFKIDELFEKLNNSYSFDEFIYIICNNLYEYYIEDEFYYKAYYELRNNNMKFYNIYELRNYILNTLKHYNLNSSFKFNNEVYEIY